MTTPKKLATSQAAINRWINRQPLSLKTACVEVLGTNRKTDVLRVLRTQFLLDYAAGGGHHEILPAGNLYFTHDATRRQEGSRLVLDAPLKGDWADNGGSEIYITPINTFRLKKDFFSDRIMHLIDPPKAAVRNGFAATQAMAGVDLDLIQVTEEGPEELFNSSEEVNPLHLQWVEIARGSLSKGEEIPAGVRAGLYLTMPRTLALINTTAERAGADLEDLDLGKAHVGRWCSYVMRQLLEEGFVFTNDKAWEAYLSLASQVTAESWLGYAPELV